MAASADFKLGWFLSGLCFAKFQILLNLNLLVSIYDNRFEWRIASCTLPNIKDGAICENSWHDSFHPLIMFAKSFILNFWQGSEYVSGFNYTISNTTFNFCHLNFIFCFFLFFFVFYSNNVSEMNIVGNVIN